MTSLSSGLPPLLVVDYLYDTQIITEVKDEYIGTLTQRKHEQYSETSPRQHNDSVGATGSLDGSIVCIYHVAAIGRYEITSLMRKLLARLFSVESMRPDDISALKRAVDEQSVKTAARIRRIRDTRLVNAEGIEVRAHQIGSFAGVSVRPFQSWAQMLLQVMTHKSYCMLYQPLLRGKYGKVTSRVRRE